MIKADVSSRPEAAFVLLLLQSLSWLIAGISAAPLFFAGEVHMAALALASMLLALGTCMVALGVLWRRRWARGWAMGIEIVCILGATILIALPIGFNRGPVSLLVNVALPIAVILLVTKRETFS